MAKDAVVLSGGATKVMRCACRHEWQDKKYGPGMRVHNKATTQYVCTVCANKRV